MQKSQPLFKPIGSRETARMSAEVGVNGSDFISSFSPTSMSTAELSPERTIDQESPSVEQADLPDVRMPGISDQTRLIIGILLLKGPIPVATNYLHGTDKGSPELISSAADLDALIERLRQQKGGQNRVEIVAHQLGRIAEDALKQRAE